MTILVSRACYLVYNTDSTKQQLNFLDITLIMDKEQNIETQIFYKETNAHDYLDYESQHPRHKTSHTTNTNRMEKHLLDLKHHLLSCNYPENIINRDFHNARLQGAAPEPADPKNTIPFVSTNYADINFLPLRKKIESLLKTTINNELKEIFKDTRVVLGLCQPKTLLRLLSKSKFSSNKTAIDIKEAYISAIIKSVYYASHIVKNVNPLLLLTRTSGTLKVILLVTAEM